MRRLIWRQSRGYNFFNSGLIGIAIHYGILTVFNHSATSAAKASAFSRLKLMVENTSQTLLPFRQLCFWQSATSSSIWDSEKRKGWLTHIGGNVSILQTTVAPLRKLTSTRIRPRLVHQSQ